MVANKLTDLQVSKAKPSHKDRLLSDGENLYLRIRPSGARSWIYIYSQPITRKRIKMGLGAYPSLELREARKLKDKYNNLLALGTDPRIYRFQEMAELSSKLELTFRTVAEEWLEQRREAEDIKRQETLKKATEEARNSGRTLDDKDIQKILHKRRSSSDSENRLKKYLYPDFGAIPLSEIKAVQVISVLKPVQKKGAYETVRRVCSVTNQIMNFAVNNGYIDSNPLSKIKNAFVYKKSDRMLTVSPDELTDVMRRMGNTNIKVVTRCAFEMQLHTLTRSKELVEMEWTEVDVNEKLWVIPAHKTKNGKQHKIPLSRYTVGLLDYIKPISGEGKYVFPSDSSSAKDLHLNVQSVNGAIKRAGMGGRLVAHGLRSIGSTKLNDEGFSSDHIEACLAHMDKDRVRDFYNNAQYISARREIMEYWSEYIVDMTKNYYSIAGQFR